VKILVLNPTTEQTGKEVDRFIEGLLSNKALNPAWMDNILCIPLMIDYLQVFPCKNTYSTELQQKLCSIKPLFCVDRFRDKR
jgi:hypothetical protein